MRRGRGAAVVPLLVVLGVGGGSGAAGAAPQLDSVSAHADRVERRLAGIERAATRWERWRTCIRGVPVSERGNVDGGVSGYRYDERDGTGVDRRAALALAAPRSADYRLLQLARRGGCNSRRTQPNGTAEAAAAGASGSPAARVAALERRVAQLRQRTRRVERSALRFDGWESCLLELPVTEFGDPGGAFGFRYGPVGGPLGFRAAIAIDRSDWDDPDYVFLAFRRGDRPGGECDNDPGVQ